VTLNSLETSASVAHLDWERPDVCALSGQMFDLVLACDVLYASKLAPVRFIYVRSGACLGHSSISS